MIKPRYSVLDFLGEKGLMKKLPFCFSLLAALLVCEVPVSAAYTNSPAGGTNPRAAHGTISGVVRDPAGRPLAGAVVSLVREGAVAGRTKSAGDGAFELRVAPGRYVLQAVLAGFDEAQFSSVNVNASDEIIYRFNLQRAGEGRTVAEQQRDRDATKFRVRAAHSRRSIFQIGEGEGEETAALVRDAAAQADAQADMQTLTGGVAGDAEERSDASQQAQGVMQTYFAASASELQLPHVGINFALARAVNDRVRLIFSGQTGSAGAPERLDVEARARLDNRHALRTRIGAARFTTQLPGFTTKNGTSELNQFSVRAVDEWIVRDGIVLVLGFDYARFGGARGKQTISPRIGFQLDANARTRLHAAYTPGANRNATTEFGRIEFEDGDVVLEDAADAGQAVVAGDGELLIERSRRFEFGVERVLDNNSRIEATAFFDTTDDRGIGLLNLPASNLRGGAEADFLRVAEQQGAARGVRVVYARRLSRRTNFSAGYSFGRGQELSPDAAANLESVTPQNVFRNAYFHTGAAQVETDFETGTQVQAVVRFSSEATVFAVDPFAGQLAVYDPSLSILITQDLPNFGLPLRLKAIVDARNLLDMSAATEEADASVLTSQMRRSVRGGIAVRF